jgi:hypothetical protein
VRCKLVESAGVESVYNIIACVCSWYWICVQARASQEAPCQGRGCLDLEAPG